MTAPNNILGIIRELQKRCVPSNDQCVISADDEYAILENFPSIATAFLALNENLKSMEETNAALLKRLHEVGDVPEKFYAAMSRLKTPKKGELHRILIQLLPS